MPLVIVTFNPKQLALTFTSATSLAKELAFYTAKTLNIPERNEGLLTPSDIEVEFKEHHPWNFPALPLQIIIFANRYPEREANLDERAKSLAESIRKSSIFPSHLIGKEQSFIWIMLVDASFVMI